GSVSLGPQHVIYGLGICDYLDGEQVRKLLDWVYPLFLQGGWLLLTNRDAASPDRAFAEHILDWPAIHRTSDEFAGLLAHSPFAGMPTEITKDDTGVTLLARCRKS